MLVKLISNSNADIPWQDPCLVEPPVGVDDDDIPRVEDSLQLSRVHACPPTLWWRCQAPPLLSSYLR